MSGTGASWSSTISSDSDEVSVQNFVESLPSPIADAAQIGDTVSAYFDPEVYAYCVFDVPTLLHAIRRLSPLLAAGDPERILVSPSTLVRDGKRLRRSLGSARLAALRGVLADLWLEHEASTLSLSGQCVAVLGEPDSGVDLFLRGLSLAAATRQPIAPQAGHVLRTLLDEGYVSDRLFIPGEHQDRCVALSRLVMTAAREFGSPPLVNTGILLTRYAGLSVDYAVAKQITACAVRTERRQLDWALKSAGRLKLDRKRGW